MAGRAAAMTAPDALVTQPTPPELPRSGGVLLRLYAVIADRPHRTSPVIGYGGRTGTTVVSDSGLTGGGSTRTWARVLAG